MASGDLINGRFTVLHASRVWLSVQQNWIYNQVKHLPADIDVHVFCRGVANLSEFRVPNIHCSSEISGLYRNSDQQAPSSHEPAASDFLETLIEEIKPSILHSHFGKMGCQSMRAARRANVTHVVTFYGHDATSWPHRDPKNLIRYRELFDTVAAVFCEGPSLAKKVVALGCPEEKALVHHLGVDLAHIPFRPRTWLPGTPLRVLIAATFREKKGIPIAIRALREICSEVDLEITIIGDSRGDWDIDEKRNILATIDQCGLAKHTRLLGFQPHAVLWNEALRHHVFLSPSITTANGDAEGGAPVTIIEMAASGMPIVSTFHCDIPEVIVHGESGWLAPERDHLCLAEHLRWLIHHPDDWRPFLDAGRRRVETLFDCRTQGLKLAERYRMLAGVAVG